MAHSNAVLGALPADPRWVALMADRRLKAWTDDYSSVLAVFNWASP
jgi:hypothetical protein